MPATLAPANASLRHPLVDGCPPSWATAWGHDAYGIFAEFSVHGSNDWVSQRLRWIPPGTFLMGSPENEPGRDSDEGPQHDVTISKAMWFFDTPCTQALWQAVMRDNPSHFVDPERPIEQVSWDDAQVFLKKLNSQVPGLTLRLPTEAEWEYACRAGTTEATPAGPIEILGENVAPILNEIAWYGGNSGVSFDLEKGRDSAGWPEKQFRHDKAGTRKVASKSPNRWGLYDMLGNVWEWCEDYWGDYSSAAAVDPTGPKQGLVRVLRGGGWNYRARSVRSAFRLHYDPGYRDSSIGFRCAQVPES